MVEVEAHQYDANVSGAISEPSECAHPVSCSPFTRVSFMVREKVGIFASCMGSNMSVSLLPPPAPHFCFLA